VRVLIPQVADVQIIARGSPRQVLGPYGRTYEPTRHLRDMRVTLVVLMHDAVKPWLGLQTTDPLATYRGTSLTRQRPPPTTMIGPYIGLL